MQKYRYTLEQMRRLGRLSASTQPPAGIPSDLLAGDPSPPAEPAPPPPPPPPGTPPPMMRGVRTPPPTAVPASVRLLAEELTRVHSPEPPPPPPPPQPGFSVVAAAQAAAQARSAAAMSAAVAQQQKVGLRAEALPFTPPGLRADAKPFQPYAQPFMPVRAHSPEPVMGAVLAPFGRYSPGRASPPWSPGHSSPERPAMRAPPPTTVPGVPDVPVVELGDGIEERS
eukprot:TRINITY_DN3097_c1_g1_i2.p1 TRINITY_DN3097_c1_g1~~TRINITY_DN3097_c1_g1_i2.p1  ORF type:complete len:226 (+),score=68.57 TRINITY_DN3097_c1_g1_i2:73-750(+)